MFISEVVLTAWESKLLIAKAVLRLDPVKTALGNGLVVTHPSSTATAILMEINGRAPEGVWAAGVVRPKGFCVGFERQQEAKAGKNSIGDAPKKNTYTWVFEKGKLRVGQALGDVLELMTPQDVYIKGCNAVDPWGKAGVLFAKQGGGTIGSVMAVQKRRNFRIILPVGLSKLIPVPIDQAARAAPFSQVAWSMGLKVGLIPVVGQTVTEVDALKILFGISATPIAAGGLGGAEGCVVLALEGEEKDVRSALTMLLDEVKGKQGPTVLETDCHDCPWTECNSPLIYRGTAAGNVSHT